MKIWGSFSTQNQSVEFAVELPKMLDASNRPAACDTYDVAKPVRHSDPDPASCFYDFGETDPAGIFLFAHEEHDLLVGDTSPEVFRLLGIRCNID